MGNNISNADIQVPRVLHHPGPFDTPEWVAYAAMAICNNNRIPVVRAKAGVGIPLEAAVIIVTDDVPDDVLADIRDARPTFSIIAATKVSLSDHIPALISTVRNNRHAAIVRIASNSLGRWLTIAGTDLVHVAIDDPVGFFGDVMGGAE